MGRSRPYSQGLYIDMLSVARGNGITVGQGNGGNLGIFRGSCMAGAAPAGNDSGIAGGDRGVKGETSPGDVLL